MMIGVAPVSLLSRTLETIATHEGRTEHANDLRRMAARGAVPVAILEGKRADVTTLDVLEATEAGLGIGMTERRDREDIGGWFPPFVAEA